MNSRNWNTFRSLEDLEKDYEEYLFNDYINKVHSELGDTPNNVWHKGIENVNVNFKFIISNNFKNKITYKVSNKKVYI